MRITWRTYKNIHKNYEFHDRNERSKINNIVPTIKNERWDGGIDHENNVEDLISNNLRN